MLIEHYVKDNGTEKAEQLVKEQYLLEYNHFRMVTGLKLNYSMRVVDEERLFMEKRLRKAYFKHTEIEEMWGAGDSRTESLQGSRLFQSMDQASEKAETGREIVDIHESEKSAEPPQQQVIEVVDQSASVEEVI